MATSIFSKFASAAHINRFKPWLNRLAKFLLGQGLVQIISFAGSFALLRWMSVEDYAVFTLTWSIQAMMMAFGDLGVGGAIVPLVGATGHEPERLGNYVAAGRQLRRILFPFVALGGAAAFWILGGQHGIDYTLIFILFILAAIAVWVNAATLFYSAPLILRQQIGYLQILQNTIAAMRVGCYAIAHFLGFVNAALPLLTNSFLQLIQLRVIKQKTHSHIKEPPASSPEAVKARQHMVKFLAPQLPILIFNTFQGQITVLLVSIIGSTTALAEIGAISRLNVVFASLAGFQGLFVIPYFSRIDSNLATRRVLQSLFAASTLLALLVFVGFSFPKPFVWVLGKNYLHLEPEIGWALLSYGTGQVAGLLAAIIYARKIVPTLAIVFIAVPILSAQLLGGVFYPPTNIHGAILLTLWTNLGSILGHGLLYALYRNRELKG